MPTPSFTHVNEKGEAHMVDVGDKPKTQRYAIAQGTILMQEATFLQIQDNTTKKGDVLAVARIAGIMAAKRTHELIPLCHPLAITKVSVDFKPLTPLDDGVPFHFTPNPSYGITCEATVKCYGETGVEMEALTAVSVALLTIYDMCKASDKGMCIGSIALLEKAGGRSGLWTNARQTTQPRSE